MELDTKLVEKINEKRKKEKQEEKNNEEFNKKSERIMNNLLEKSLKKDQKEIRGEIYRNKDMTMSFRKKALIGIAAVSVIALGVLGSHKLKEKDMYDNYMRTVKNMAEQELGSSIALNEFESSYHPDKVEIIDRINEVVSTFDRSEYNLSGYGEAPDNYIANSGINHMEQNAINIIAQDEINGYENSNNMHR